MGKSAGLRQGYDARMTDFVSTKTRLNVGAVS